MASSQGVQQNGREQHEDDPIAPEPQRWRDSDAQKLLRQLLATGMIPESGMKPKDIWDNICSSRPEFAGFHFKNFPSRLRSARQQGIQKGSRAVSENAAFEHDRLLFPPATHNQRGEPRWHGSPAESLLKHDVAEKRHEKMAPQLLRETRVEYMEFPLDVFRKHIHQEVRLRKLIFQYQTNRG
jgi:hypothetical protein